MRYAIVSDIHANLPAWCAVLEDLDEQAVDEVICLGDIVGYGPQPCETFHAMRDQIHHCILGNHDAVVGGVMGAERFNPAARRVIEWTAKQFDPKTRDFFAGLPLSLAFEDDGVPFVCVHGGMNSPGTFPYVLEEKHARASLAATDAALTFVGHTHLPRIDRTSPQGQHRRYEPGTFVLEKNARYIVNVGSVGMPREKDVSACYCVFDTTRKRIEYRRIPYDFESFRQIVNAWEIESKEANRLLSLYDLGRGGGDVAAVTSSAEAEIEEEMVLIEMESGDEVDTVFSTPDIAASTPTPRAVQSEKKAPRPMSRRPNGKRHGKERGRTEDGKTRAAKAGRRDGGKEKRQSASLLFTLGGVLLLVLVGVGCWAALASREDASSGQAPIGSPVSTARGAARAPVSQGQPESAAPVEKLIFSSELKAITARWPVPQKDPKANWQVDKEEGHDAPGSFRVHIAPSGKKKLLAPSRPVSQLKTGMAYRATCWMRTEGVSEDRGACLVIKRGDADGSDLFIDPEDKKVNNREWTIFTVEGTVQDGKKPVRVYLALSGQGTAWFDDLKIVQVPTPAP